MISGSGHLEIANNTQRRYGRTGARRQFVIANTSAIADNRTLFVGGSDGAKAIPVFGKNIITIETDSEFYIINDSGAAVTYTVAEVFGILRVQVVQ